MIIFVSKILTSYFCKRIGRENSIITLALECRCCHERGIFYDANFALMKVEPFITGRHTRGFTLN